VGFQNEKSEGVREDFDSYRKERKSSARSDFEDYVGAPRVKQEIDRGKRHDITAIDQGLVYLARAHGKALKASRLMAEDGLQPVPSSTLNHWKRSPTGRGTNSAERSGRSASAH
jgi:hypothetical protein